MTRQKYNGGIMSENLLFLEFNFLKRKQKFRKKKIYNKYKVNFMDIRSEKKN